MTSHRTTQPAEAPAFELAISELATSDLDRAAGGALYHWDELLTVVAQPRPDTGVRHTR